MECWEASCLDHAIAWAGTIGNATEQLQQGERQCKRIVEI